MTHAHRVTIWSGDGDVYEPEPAHVNTGGQVCELKINDNSWPDALDPDDIDPGWQILASARDEGIVYEGEIAATEDDRSMAGRFVILKCEPPEGYDQPPTALQGAAPIP